MDQHTNPKKIKNPRFKTRPTAIAQASNLVCVKAFHSVTILNQKAADTIPAQDSADRIPDQESAATIPHEEYADIIHDAESADTNYDAEPEDTFPHE